MNPDHQQQHTCGSRNWGHKWFVLKWITIQFSAYRNITITWSMHEEKKKQEEGKIGGDERKGAEKRKESKKEEQKRKVKKNDAPGMEPRTFCVVGQSSNH